MLEGEGGRALVSGPLKKALFPYMLFQKPQLNHILGKRKLE